MATVKFQINKILKQAINSVHVNSVKHAIGREGKKIIRERTQDDGKRVVKDGTRPLKALKKSTIARRARLRNNGELSSKTSPGRSNLTRTGDMIKSLAYKTKQFTVTFFFKGKKNQGKIDNLDKMPGFRKVLSFSGPELKRLTDIVSDYVRRNFS